MADPKDLHPQSKPLEMPFPGLKLALEAILSLELSVEWERTGRN